MSKKIEQIIAVEKVLLTVSGTYHPEEKEERYDDNMTGTPGSNAEFELESVKAGDIEIIELISNSIYDEIIDIVLDYQKD